MWIISDIVGSPEVLNRIALMVVISVYVLDDRNRIAGIVAFFYTAYLSVEFLSAFVSMSNSDWMIANAFIDLIVVYLCYHSLIHKNKSLLVTVYMLYVIVFYLTPELMLANYRYEPIVMAYENVMDYAITIDIIFVLLGSINVKTRLFSGDIHK